MSSRKNLNDNVADTFPFTVGGLDYDLKYPTMEELEPITQLNTQREKALEANDSEELARIDEELENTFYSFILPIGHQEPIKEVIKKQPFPVVKAFNKMVSEQLSAE